MKTLTSPLTSKDRGELDFADDIASIFNERYQVQKLLSRVEISATKIGLRRNVKETEYMSFNQWNDAELFALSGSKLNVVENFK